MEELGTLHNPNYKIAMLVDDGAMINVQDEEGHVVRWGGKLFSNFRVKITPVSSKRRCYTLCPKESVQ